MEFHHKPTLMAADCQRIDVRKQKNSLHIERVRLLRSPYRNITKRASHFYSAGLIMLLILRRSSFFRNLLKNLV